jgi:Leucine-rich repeat (LRR) protein
MSKDRFSDSRAAILIKKLLRFMASAAALGILPFFTQSLQAAVSQQDRDGLIAFYNALGGSQWANKTGWLGPPGTECSWYGVTCDQAQTTVTGLSFSRNALSGAIPSDILKLIHLQTLSLKGDWLTGIPNEIGNLPDLQVLELDGGPAFASGRVLLPTTLSNLLKIQILDISGFDLAGSLPAGLGNLTQLKVLRLISKHYSGLGPPSYGLTGNIPAEIGNLANLQILDLESQCLSGGLPDELGNLTQLNVLNVSNNSISCQLGGGIPSSVGNLRNLQTLKLIGDGLFGDIPPTLLDMPNLEDLEISFGLLGGLSGLGNLKSLKTLSLTTLQIANIPPEFGNLTNLQTLDLRSNRFSTLPAELGNLKNLQTLILSSNRIASLPSELGSLTSLQRLEMSQDELGSIPKELGNLANLQTLDLSANRLSDIPGELGNLKNLQTLDLSASGLTTIPMEFGKLESLKTFNLARNTLVSIPNEFGNLTNLQTLDLSGNKLSSVPKGLGNLRSLETLELSSNQLSEIPAEIGNLENLHMLDLSVNHLQDIPTELGNLASLQYLWLYGNHLQSIPSELGKLNNLLSLELSNNRLSGSIPSSLGNLTSLTRLTLGQNRLSGAVPSTLSGLKNCLLDLAFNALYTNDPNVADFLSSADLGWDETQTVAPANISATLQADSSILVSWTPIPFAVLSGRYGVWTSASSGGPYTLSGSTADKRTPSLVLTGLGLGTRLVVRTITDPNDSNQNTVVSDFSAEVSVGVPKTSVDFALNSTGAASSTTMGSIGTTQAGYAEAGFSAGSAPYATAIFSYSPNGIVVSEAGVPASPPTTSARIFIDYRTGAAIPASSGTVNIGTGFAAVNRGDGPATITFTLRDSQGRILTSGTGSLAKGAHIAKYVQELPQLAPGFQVPDSFPTSIQFGTLDLSSNQPLSVVALRLTTNQRGETLLSTTPVADLARPSPTGPLYFPQLADGGGYTTTIILFNTSNAAESGRVSLFNNAGGPLPVQLVNGLAGPSFTYSIPPGGASVFQTDASPVYFNVGWAELMPDTGTSTPVGAGVYQQSMGGILISESGIPSATPTTHARIFVDTTGGHNTGFALGNPSTAQQQITLTAFHMDGSTQAGRVSGPVSLNGKGHSAGFVYLWVDRLPAAFQGVVDITSATPFVALALRSLLNKRLDVLVTAFPVADLNMPAPFPVIFPQIADGGGYTTEFILISAGSSATAKISFFGDSGDPLAVGK